MILDDACCLVTGGAGFIGSHLVDALLQRGCRVRVLDNLTNGKIENLAHHLDDERFEFVRGSVTDPFDVEAALSDVSVVFHLACLGVRQSLRHPFENHRVNAEGSLLVLQAAWRARVERFLYCSSSEVYGTAQVAPMTEEHPTHPCTVYGASKLAGEAYTRAYYLTHAMKTVIIRLFNTYGPRSHHEGDAGEVIPKSIVRSLNGRDILVFGDGSQTRDFTYVEDSARALAAAAECEAMIGQTLNVGSNFEISIKELTAEIAAMACSPGSIQFTPGRPGDVLRLHADPHRFMQLCDWRPQTDFQTGLRQTVAYFRDHPLGLAGLLRAESGRSWEHAAQ